jgi:hypothetical protein
MVQMNFHSTKALILKIQNPKYKIDVKKSFNDLHQNHKDPKILHVQPHPQN